eukprot:jgi/Mesvir1/8237/Mv12518-RA.2
MGGLLGPEDIASRHANLLRSILSWDYNDLINKQSKSLTKRRRCPHTSEDQGMKARGDEEGEEQGEEEEWAEDEEDWETCRLCEEEKEHEARLYGLKHVPPTFSSPESYLAVFDALLLEEARAQIIVGDERAGAYSSGQTMLLHMAAVTAMDSASDFTRVKLGVKPESQSVLRDNDLVLLIRSDQKVDMAGGNSMPDNAFAVLEGQSWRNVLNARLFLEESIHGVPLPARHAARASIMKRLLASSAGSPKPWWIVKICNLSTITREYLALQAIHTLPMRPFILDPKPAVAALKPCATWSVPTPLWQYLEANHNPSQLEAIHLATTNMPIALIQGPPGTGKTHTILGLLSAILHSVPTATADRGGKATTGTAGMGEGKGRADGDTDGVDGLPSHVQQLQAAAQHWVAASPWLTGRADPRSVLDTELESDDDDSDGDGLPLTMAERAAARRRRHIIPDEDDDEDDEEDGGKGKAGDVGQDERARLIAGVRARKQFYYTSSASAALSVPTVVRMLASSSRSHVLVCAPSNAALDEVVLRLITVGLHDAQGNQYIPSVVRVGVNPHHSVAAVTMDALLAERVAQVQQRASSSTLTQAAENKGSLDRLRVAILDEADIVCSTLSFSGSAVFARMSRSFDVVVVDEASQAVESSILVPLCNGTKQLIMVGDPRQLPATVLSVRATEHGYTQSMFQRVQAAGLPVALLRTQYRMHPHISRFPSHQFYERTLEDGPDMAKATDKPWHASRLFGPFTFFDVKGAEKAAKGTGSFQNEEEALFTLELYKELVRQHPRLKNGSQIGILSPYKQQVWRVGGHEPRCTHPACGAFVSLACSRGRLTPFLI